MNLSKGDFISLNGVSPSSSTASCPALRFLFVMIEIDFVKLVKNTGKWLTGLIIIFFFIIYLIDGSDSELPTEILALIVLFLIVIVQGVVFIITKFYEKFI